MAIESWVIALDGIRSGDPGGGAEGGGGAAALEAGGIGAEAKGGGGEIAAELASRGGLAFTAGPRFVTIGRVAPGGVVVAALCAAASLDAGATRDIAADGLAGPAALAEPAALGARVPVVLAGAAPAAAPGTRGPGALAGAAPAGAAPGAVPGTALGAAPGAALGSEITATGIVAPNGDTTGGGELSCPLRAGTAGGKRCVPISACVGALGGGGAGSARPHVGQKALPSSAGSSQWGQTRMRSPTYYVAPPTTSAPLAASAHHPCRASCARARLAPVAIGEKREAPLSQPSSGRREQLAYAAARALCSSECSMSAKLCHARVASGVGSSPRLTWIPHESMLPSSIDQRSSATALASTAR